MPTNLLIDRSFWLAKEASIAIMIIQGNQQSLINEMGVTFAVSNLCVLESFHLASKGHYNSMTSTYIPPKKYIYIIFLELICRPILFFTF